MTSPHLQYVADLAQKGGKLVAGGAADERLFAELAQWLLDALEHHADEDIAQVLQLARRDSSESERYLTRATRVIAGAQNIPFADGPDEWLHLLAIPLFLYPQQDLDLNVVMPALTCRSEIERSLEQALGLGFASIRLCDHPVSAIDLESLDISKTRQMAKDLLLSGNSSMLTPPIIDVGSSPEAAHHQALLWPAVWKVKASARESLMRNISGALFCSQQLAQFKHRADELLEQELAQRQGLSVRADIYMPAFFHDIFAVFRLVELNTMLSRTLNQFRASCHSVSFGLFGTRLQYSLLDATGEILTSDELRAPEESRETISTAVRAACARHGIACTAKMPL